MKRDPNPYSFFLFKQNRPDVNIPESWYTGDILTLHNFDVNDFATENNLEGVFEMILFFPFT